MGCELKATEASPDWREGMREGRPESRAALCDTCQTKSGNLQHFPPCSLLQGTAPQLLAAPVIPPALSTCYRSLSPARAGEMLSPDAMGRSLSWQGAQQNSQDWLEGDESRDQSQGKASASQLV